jgi:hypothetical protein
MPIVAVNGSGNTPQGVDAPPPSRLMLKEDGAYVFDGTQLAAGAGQDAPSINEIVVTKVTDVSSTLLFREGDTFDFQPQLTSEPTAPQAGGGHKDWIKVESFQFADNADADGKGYLLTSIQHSVTEESQLGDPITFASAPSSQTSFPGFTGGVFVASARSLGDYDAADFVGLPTVQDDGLSLPAVHDNGLQAADLLRPVVDRTGARHRGDVPAPGRLPVVKVEAMRWRWLKPSDRPPAS